MSTQATKECKDMDDSANTVGDLAQHLAYHASVGYAECRDMDVPTEGEPVPFEDAAGKAIFTVQHGGKHYRVTVEQWRG